MLSLPITGEALQKVKAMKHNNGIEVWRQLPGYYDPQACGRQEVLMKQLLSPAKVSGERLLMEALETWEEHSRRWETRNKSFFEDMKVVVMTDMSPKAVRTTRARRRSSPFPCRSRAQGVCGEFMTH